MKLITVASSKSLHQILLQYLDNFLSLNTRAAYVNDLKQFTDFMSTEFPEASHPTQITTQHIIQFREHLRSGYSPATVNRRLSALSSLFRELLEKNVIEKNPVLGIKRPPNQSLRAPTGYSDEEVEQILNSYDEDKAIDLQHKCIFAFLFFTGARVSELRAVKISDFDQQQGLATIRISGKGAKIRHLPLHPELQRLLAKLVETRAKKIDDFLFTSTKSTKNTPLARMTIHEFIKKKLSSLGLETNRSCHSSRRTLISNLLENGHRLEEVQKIAGHASPTTTLRYNVRDADMKSNPLLQVDFKKKKSS